MWRWRVELLFAPTSVCGLLGDDRWPMLAKPLPAITLQSEYSQSTVRFHSEYIQSTFRVWDLQDFAQFPFQRTYCLLIEIF